MLQNNYYIIILDCTQDIARIEQLSFVMRITNQNTVEIEENFVEFIAVGKITGEKLVN